MDNDLKVQNIIQFSFLVMCFHFSQKQPDIIGGGGTWKTLIWGNISFFSFFLEAALSALRATLTILFLPHCLALILYRKDNLDHMPVPIKTLAVGIQELHRSHGKP